MVPVQVRMPLWLKRQMLVEAGREAKDMSEWVRSVIVAALRDKGISRRAA